ncbi:MAG: phosphate ABC transporter substrate-binding protein [Elusimicrobiota bacterium]|jgi:phosphate transport system substrate-binding protein|nr:phosphate ABC transporter substrate-binding protein [Elusimicrobiota bacterium]
MIKKLLILFSVCIFLIGCSPQKENAAGIQIKGSDTIVNLVQVWVENFVAQNPGISIGITGGGSGTGFAALINSTCDIAMSSRKIEAIELEAAQKKNLEIQEFIIGYDGLVILVNINNPVSELTMAQIRDIFMGNVVNWRQVGGDDLEIVVLSRESNSGTHMFFKENVLRMGNPNLQDEFSDDVLLMPSSQAIYDEVSQNPHAVGYVGMGFSSSKVKVLRVAKAAAGPYIQADVNTILSGKYPISRPLFLYTKADPQGLVKSFIDFALSPDGQQIVVETDFVPLKTKEPK